MRPLLSMLSLAFIPFIPFIPFTLLFTLLTFSLPQTSLAATYKAQGWQWYSVTIEEDEDEEIEENNQLKPMVTTTEAPIMMSYKDQLKDFQAHYEEAQAKAIITRSKEDVEYAMRLHNFMINSSKQYGVAFQKVLLESPDLSHQVVFPTQDSARMISKAVDSKRRKSAIAEYAKSYGLFFFYKGEDVYAQGMADSTQSFADTYNISLVGVPVDGKGLKSIHVNLPESGQIKQWGVKALPALFLYHRETQQVQPFHYGFISENQIEEQFLKLATDFYQKPLAGDVTHEVE
ncbi:MULTISPECIES: type-F conjugative transfer system pilin assembly protein TraF [Cysteiniphilum]|uniref:type-F conjugative transfer system pilin assembly protein TraF n=1 Tax=Cysteiniphilum TaxID=2056696 RepID=UPI00177E687F|nr:MULTISPECIES: type-F conjugative transfer system pilin assembly protein TraF [Cysteiniphilum]